MRRAALAVAALLALAVPAGARTLQAGPGKAFRLPSQAIAAAHDGDTVLIAPGTYADCAVVRQNRLTIRGAGRDAAAVTLADRPCDGKALLVTVGDAITVRNLTLAHARVPNRNGAGIRAEGAGLTIDHVRFIDNEDGILAAPNPASVIRISRSLFERNGVCAPVCAHGIYVNAVKLLRVDRSRFVGTRQGHHLKSRALRTEVLDSVFRDGATGTASYAIDVPNGGALVVRGNSIEKGPMSENHCCAIIIGAEGVTHPTPEILVQGNRLVNDGAFDTVLLDNRTATPAVLAGNRISGRAAALRGPGRVR